MWQVLQDIGQALSHVHAMGLVHLDVKPANLLIGDEGTVQIDIGLNNRTPTNNIFVSLLCFVSRSSPLLETHRVDNYFRLLHFYLFSRCEDNRVPVARFGVNEKSCFVICEFFAFASAARISCGVNTKRHAPPASKAPRWSSLPSAALVQEIAAVFPSPRIVVVATV